MSFLEAIVLGAIEGVTEFLPISSTGHLTVAEKLIGFNVDDADVTAFTAIIQIGAVAAVVIYFREDLWGIVKALAGGVVDSAARDSPRLPLRARGRGRLDPDRDRRARLSQRDRGSAAQPLGGRRRR